MYAQVLLKKNNKILQFSKRYYKSVSVFGHVTNGKSCEDNCFKEDEIWKTESKESNFYKLVEAYRKYGHIIGNVDSVPLKNISKNCVSKFELSRYGLQPNDTVRYNGILNVDNKEQGPVSEAIEQLKLAYTQYIGAEFMHLEHEEEIQWFSEQIESLPKRKISIETKRQLATELLKSQVFDNFLASKFPGLKRYGGEGAESMMAFFLQLFKQCSEDTLQQIVLCMPHRGRLCLLTGMLNFPPVKLFKKLKGFPDYPERFSATGDVVSHLISTTSLGDKNLLGVSLLYNPSHLEAVNPVSMGKTRGKQLSVQDGDYYNYLNKKSVPIDWSTKVLNVQVHGDAAYAGQGVNQECLALSNVPNFEIGGSVHLVVNNQVGFTTPSYRGRSSRYCTDLAKSINAPVIHVNGCEPESVLLATEIAVAYQRRFRKEVFVDMNCYRRWGHNEVDDPTFTNPKLYNLIHARDTVPNEYVKKLTSEGALNEMEAEDIKKKHRKWLDVELTKSEQYTFEDDDAPCFRNQWTGFKQASSNTITNWDTGVDTDLLRYVGNKSVAFPGDFTIHPHLLKTHVKNRKLKMSECTSIDWSTAETLAIGSLLYQGYNVRLSGQDVGRGTFSHRHVMLVDQNTDETFIPLNSIHPKQAAYLEVANSILSEEAVLGFEYGMSIENPNNLIVWEAQFGDFSNGAQIIIDTFISSGELKWLWSSGLVMLLPHGYDGAGPEHSSSRLERFLQISDSKENTGADGDNVNMQIVQPSTPAQYFHLLRRQMIRDFRKPLIVIAPKTLLRLSAAQSSLQELSEGTQFSPVLGDFEADSSKVKKVIFTSGKQFYELASKRKELGIQDTALVRVECFCPFPAHEIQEQIAKYKNATKYVWSQEEPQNMGAWSFLQPRFQYATGRKISYCGRPILGAPAVGFGNVHKEQAAYVISQPFNM